LHGYANKKDNQYHRDQEQQKPKIHNFDKKTMVIEKEIIISGKSRSASWIAVAAMPE